MSTLDELKRAADPRTGLVPMVVRKPMMPYAEGQIAGFPPELAVAYEASGTCEVFSGQADAGNVAGPPAGSHAAAFTGTVGAAAAGVPGPVPAVTRYDRRPENSPRAQSVPAAVGGEGTPVESAELPEGWRELPAPKLREIAASLSGRRMVELSAEESVKIIEAAEEGRRVGRGDFGIEGDPRAMAHTAGAVEPPAGEQPAEETKGRRKSGEAKDAGRT
jgi:hypothetical protein